MTSTASHPPMTSYAVLFQLETGAAGGRETAFDIARKMLAAKGSDISEVFFLKNGLDTVLDATMGRLMSALSGRMPVEKVEAEFQENLHNRLTAKAELDPRIDKLLKLAAARGAGAACFSALPEETAQALFLRLGLDKRGVHRLPPDR